MCQKYSDLLCSKFLATKLLYYFSIVEKCVKVELTLMRGAWGLMRTALSLKRVRTTEKKLNKYNRKEMMLSIRGQRLVITYCFTGKAIR